MKHILAVLACTVSFTAVGYSAAITNVSATRTVFADALAGGAGNHLISSSEFGLFDITRTDEEISGAREARALTLQRTTLAVTSSSITLTGAGYSRLTSEGDLVAANGRSSVDVYFTIDANFTYTLSGTVVVAGTGLGDLLFQNADLFRISSTGSETLVASAISGARSGVIGTGNYHLLFAAGANTTNPEFVPQARDRTVSIPSLSFTLVPEPSAAILILAASALMMLKRGSTPGAPALADL